MKDGITDGFFLRNIKAFLDGILLIFHAQETCKSTTHNPGLHPKSLTMTSIPSHDNPIFITTALLQHMKMRRVMSLTTSSADTIIYSKLQTKFAVTGRYEVHPGILRSKHTTINRDGNGVGRWRQSNGGVGRWRQRSGIGRWHWAAVEDCNGGVGRKRQQKSIWCQHH